MRSIFSAVALVAVTACAGGGELDPAANGAAIIGGTNDREHPAVAFLSNDVVAGCSGTLISSKLVLTAAHCVVNGASIRPLDAVVFGSTMNATNRRRGVQVVWNPGYRDEFPYPNDVAIIVLDARASVEPMALNDTVPEKGQSLTFVGFGLQESPSGDFGVKQKVTVPIDSVDEQWILYGPATCQGDSGGPALLTVGDQERIAGIISWGAIGCHGTNGAQRVDLNLAWIQEQIAIYDPPSCEQDYRCIPGCPTGDADCPCAPDDGVCSALCTDPESDPDCPRGCGPGDSCVSGPTCPAPDPDCGDPCGGEGHCLESCATRDPDCPAPKAAGAPCERDFECGAAVCLQKVCTETCDPAVKACGDGGTCTRLSPTLAVCKDQGGGDEGGGCAVGGGGGAAGVGWILLLLSLARRPRPRSRRASSRR